MNISLINDKKFKSIFIDYNFTFCADEEELSKSVVVASILSKSSNKYKNQTEIQKYLLGLYGTTFDVGVQKVGKYFNIDFKVEFVNKNYLPESKDLLEEILNFLKEIIYNPLIVDGKFDEKIVESEKNSILQKVLSKKENKMMYAINQTEGILNPNDISGKYLFGDEKYIINSTADSLYAQYLNIIKNSNQDIIISGNLGGYDNMEEKIYEIFKSDDKSKVSLLQQNNYDYMSEPKVVKEVIEAQQSVLTFGINFSDIKKDELYALMVYNAILGTTPSSKLFTNFREKHSLAYTVASKFYRFKNQIIIYAGINKKNYEEAVKVIYEQLDSIKNGNISEIELNSAKDSIISNYEKLKDSKISLAKLKFVNECMKDDISIDHVINKIKNITKKDVEYISNKANVYCIYLLGGTMDE